ncbi:VaFE repeat-containing surface-anchored protein, partial [Microbacterium sp. ZW T5_56]|uniref:VaFE repeat-containing surface-anchored protein n=1 Tax=Microbacterium sp. ZW T5_56 TaxID=3378081 RepID=UPI0038536572
MTQPTDPANPGNPDYWSYCIEHFVSAKTLTTAELGDFSSFLGTNYFASNPQVQAKVMWVLAHSWPSVSLDDLATAAGVTNLSQDDAIEATQQVIWRWTELTYDIADYTDSTPNGRAVVAYLIAGSNADTATAPPAPASVAVSVDAPPAGQQAESLVGPFVVHTNQAVVSVATTSGLAIVDASGNAVDPANVTDGQVLYLDARAVSAAGSATITASAVGASGTGWVISVPTTSGGTPTSGSHAQTMILVAGSNATTTASAGATWNAVPQPAIGTTLVDSADDDHVLGWNGGTVIDTIAYQNLTPGVEYTVTGELMLKGDGTATGITGTTTFTPTAADGTTTVTFTVPAGFAGEVLVAYETLFESADLATPVAEHKDLNDAAQTVTVDDQPLVPAIGTTLVDSVDGDHVLAWDGGTVVDTIAYQNLTPGVEYTVTGELVLKSDGSATGITASATFTPTLPIGTTTVTFTVPTGHAGEVLVAYETLFESADLATPVAEHKDLNDAAQTVTVDDQPLV